MAPNAAAVTTLLRQAVHYHIDNGFYDNALFFSERLVAHDARSSESAYLLALSHFHLGDFRSAYEVSKPTGYRGIHLGSAFIFAQSCYTLEKYREGITALEKAKGMWLHKSNMGKHTATSRSLQPDAAVVCCLLGKLYRAMDDKKRAVSYFEEALKSNPFMWDAFTSLCDMGVSMRVPNIFRSNEVLLRNFDKESSDGTTTSDPKESYFSPAEPLSRKAQPRVNQQDFGDVFDQNRSTAFQDVPSFSNLMAGDPEDNEFLSKIVAARSRYAAGQQAIPVLEGMETPPEVSSAADTVVARSNLAPEPPQAPPRRRGGLQTTEGAFQDGVPKMSHRLMSKRKDKPLDGEQPVSAAEQAMSMSLLRSTSMSASVTERKRTASGHPVASRTTQIDDGPHRRSARLNTFKSSTGRPNSGAATIGAGATRELKKARAPISRIARPGSSGNTVGRVVSGNRKPIDDSGMDVDHAEGPRTREASAVPPVPPIPKQVESDNTKTEEALRWVLELLKKLGAGYLALSQFQCQETLQILGSLPRSHSDTPWVLAQMGRAQYEQAAYPEAEKYFRRVRILAPTRLEDMEVYSTILWHLKRETDLSFLAHELVDSSWHSPEAWCSLGNAWSLAQDHEQALRCFKRATQLNPKFAYAYTLQGHEYVLNEEYDKALTAYRHAVSADRRHYNAYYGIGKVYEKLGNLDKAYTHYQAASMIHPKNAVLICCLGTVMEKQKQLVQALQYFSKATDLAPKAAQTRFKKARALLALGKQQDARTELMILKDLAPDEARVHFLLGKLFKSMGSKKDAVHHFTIALSLDPKVTITCHMLSFVTFQFSY
jgi:anaphase-promoting complex subunit 3